MEMPDTCEGPLIWFGIEPPEQGAILECANPDCGYFIATGSFHNKAHAQSPMLPEGLT